MPHSAPPFATIIPHGPGFDKSERGISHETREILIFGGGAWGRVSHE